MLLAFSKLVPRLPEFSPLNALIKIEGVRLPMIDWALQKHSHHCVKSNFLTSMITIAFYILVLKAGCFNVGPT